MRRRRPSHLIFYIVETVIIIGILGVILTLGFSIWTELMLLAGMLTSYIVLGLIHHRIHQDVKGRIVLEYILISALLLAAFLFVNMHRL